MSLKQSSARALALGVLVSLVAAAGAEAAPTSYPGQVTGEPSLVAFWKLDDALSTTAADTTGMYPGEYKNGVIVGRPGGVACERRTNFGSAVFAGCAGVDLQGYSAFFSGSSSGTPYVGVTSIPAPSSYTLEAWIHPSTTGGNADDGGIVDHGNNGVLWIEGNKVHFRATSVATTVDSATVTWASNGGWHYVAGTWDNVSKTATLTVDGVAVSGPAEPYYRVTSGAPAFYIGRSAENGGFHGEIDDVAYYGSLLAPATLATHYGDGSFDDSATAPWVTSITPSPGARYNLASTKWAQSVLNFACSPATASCTATVDGIGTANGGALQQGAGSHAIVVSADAAPAGNSSYTVGTFADVVKLDSSGLLAYYRLDDPLDAVTMADSSGNGHHGEFKNDQNAFTGGVSNDTSTARKFLGDGGYGYVNGIASPYKSFTMEAWVTTNDTGDQSVMEHGGAGAIWIRNVSAGQPRFVFRPNVNVPNEIVGANTVACKPKGVFNTWQQVAATWDGVMATLYVDGQPCASADLSMPPGPTGAATLYLGYGSQAPWLRGALDEVSYYGAALSAQQVLRHYLADPPVDAGREAASAPAAPASSSPAASPAPQATVAVASKPQRVVNTKAKAKAKAKARAKARAKAKALALAKAKAKAKARARAKAKARARSKRH